MSRGSKPRSKERKRLDEDRWRHDDDTGDWSDGCGEGEEDDGGDDDTTF